MSEDEMLKHFDDIFGTNTVKHINLNMPLVKLIFDHLEEKPTLPNIEYKNATRKKIKISDKLCKTLTAEQVQLFEEYKELNNEAISAEEQQLFCFGYIFALEFAKEGIIDKE